jgi:signal transduction histidine kinase
MAVDLRGRAWAVCLTAGSLAVAVYVAVTLSSLWDGVAYAGFGLAAVVVIVIGVRIKRPRAASAWYLIALSQLLFVTGDVIWTTFDVLHIDPWPSIADVSYLAGYPVLAAGLLRLTRARRDTGDRRALIDASIVTLGLGLLGWIFLIDPYFHQGLSVLELAISIAYPLGDLLVLAVVARLLTGGVSRTPAFGFVATSLIALLVADLVYGVQQFGSGYEIGGWLDGFWLMSYLLLAVAALHPTMVRLTEPEDIRPHVGRRRLAVLAAAALLAPVAMVIQGRRGFEVHDVWLLAICSAALFLLVVARMGGLVREVEGVVEELTELQEERKHLMDRTLKVQEEERMRLAAELHDGPLQRLASLGYGLDRVRLRLEKGDAAAANEVLEPLQDTLSNEIQSLRDIMSSIRPPALDEQGLEGALRDEVARFAARIGAEWGMEAELRGRLDPEIETVLYRVTQEALRNVAKHARASRIDVELRQTNGRIEFSLRDDGAGFDPADASALVREGRFGLVAMKERIRLARGTCVIESKPGSGTILRATFDRGARA